MTDLKKDDGDEPEAGTVEAPAGVTGVSNRIVPEAIAGRFLRIDDRYYFPDRSLAFIDSGARLKVRTHNLEVVHSIVAIMQARGWRSVRLSGTREFRQKVWHEATLQGIGVEGYQPDALEMQQLQRALDRQRETRPSKEPAPPAAGETTRRPSRDGLRAPVAGVLLAHAAAPYQFDTDQRMSYYVRVRTEVGERTVWGTDLERAVAESRSNVMVGDEVVLRQRGARPVTVRVAERNAAGELVGDKKLVTQRMGWTVEKAQFLEALERKATILRTPQTAASDILAQHPDLAGAVVGLKLAEQFARRLTPRSEDQARVVQAIRTRLANAVAQGLQIRTPAQRLASGNAPVRAPTRSRSSPTREDPPHLRG